VMKNRRAKRVWLAPVIACRTNPLKAQAVELPSLPPKKRTHAAGVGSFLLRMSVMKNRRAKRVWLAPVIACRTNPLKAQADELPSLPPKKRTHAAGVGSFLSRMSVMKNRRAKRGFFSLAVEMRLFPDFQDVQKACHFENAHDVIVDIR